MRVLDKMVKRYFLHTELTPANVRFTEETTLLPEPGEELTGEFGYESAEITSRVVRVLPLGSDAYEVYLSGTVKVGGGDGTRAKVGNTELGRAIGLSDTSASMIRNGNRLPSITVMAKISEVYGWSMNSQTVSYLGGTYGKDLEAVI